MQCAKSFMQVLWGLFLMLGILLLPTLSDAQKKPRGTAIKLDDIKVVGKIQKPQAFYVLHRAPLNYKNFQLKRNFIGQVIGAVKKSPF